MDLFAEVPLGCGGAIRRCGILFALFLRPFVFHEGVHQTGEVGTNWRQFRGDTVRLLGGMDRCIVGIGMSDGFLSCNDLHRVLSVVGIRFVLVLVGVAGLAESIQERVLVLQTSVVGSFRNRSALRES